MKAFAIITDVIVLLSLLITMVLLDEARSDLWVGSLFIILIFLLVFVLFCIFATIHSFKRK